LGVPFDRTSSFLPGSRFGPDYVRIAAENVESYSPYQRRDLSPLPIHDAGDIRFDSVARPLVSERIRQEIAGIVLEGKLPVSLGGEHSITGPIVAAVHDRFPDLVVVQFDAHADLRCEFLGEPHSHATAMYLCGQIVGPENVFQYGIRSGTQEEFAQARNLYPFSVLAPLQQTKARFRGRPVYLTIDIDVLDPGVMPAVSAPEPGGIAFPELVAALLELRGCRIVGIDIVEYNPLSNRDLASASLVAVLLREALLVANPSPAGP
jgi:agmatinase